MKEKEPIRHFSDNVRDYAHKIVETHGHILSIDNVSLGGNLVEELQIFKRLTTSHYEPVVDMRITSENELGLTLYLDVINFCYRNPYSKNDYVYTDPEGKRIARATGLRTAMLNADVNWGNTHDVSKMNPKKWSEIIQLDNNKDFYLGENRGKRISEFAWKLSKAGFKNITDFLTFTEYDAEIILPILDQSRYFNDEFKKRSQLAVNMLNGVLKSRLGKELIGIENLTVMADYRLPQVMYNFGAIKLSENLYDKLTKQEIIESGSPEELALRAASVVIGEKLSKILGINEGEVDTLLWNLAQKMSKQNKLIIPHMLVATDKY